MSSYPTTATSSGTRIPPRSRPCTTPHARWSLVVTTPSGRSLSGRSAIRAPMDAPLQSRPLTPHQLEADAGVSLDRLPDALQPLAHLPHLFARAEEGEPRPAQ